MDRRNELGLLTITPEVVTALAARMAGLQGAIAGLVRRGGAADSVVLARRHWHRAIAVQELEGIWFVTVTALAKAGSSPDDLEVAARRMADGIVVLLGPESSASVELRIVGIRRLRPDTRPPEAGGADALGQGPAPGSDRVPKNTHNTHTNHSSREVSR